PAEVACRTNCSDDKYRARQYFYTCQKASVSNNGHEEVKETITTSSQEWIDQLEKEKAKRHPQRTMQMASWRTIRLAFVAPTDRPPPVLTNVH
ncbi:hypothetical protein Bpfe_010881, partial [Biomphalaria pfeifferi]